MQKTILYTFVVLLFIISCQDKDSTLDDQAPAKKCRLVKMIQGTHNGAEKDTTFNFYYDATGKLNKITNYLSGYNQTDTSILTYNDSGKLVKIAGTYNTGTTFTYTSNGSLSEIYYPTHGYEKWRFIYSSSTLPEKCVKTTYTSVGSFTHLDSLEYRYTYQNGNMITQETFIHGASSNKRNFEYDTVPNLDANLSLVSLRDVPLGLSEEFFYFNKNMLKRKTSTVENSYFTYKLDSGRIVQSFIYQTSSPTSGATPNVTRNYFWECQ